MVWEKKIVATRDRTTDLVYSGSVFFRVGRRKILRPPGIEPQTYQKIGILFNPKK